MQNILEQLKKGKISVKAAEKKLREHFLDVYGIARLDLHREHRTGIPEVVIALDKTDQHLINITIQILEHAGRVIITRLTNERNIALRKLLGKRKLLKKCNIKYYSEPQVCIIHDKKFKIIATNGTIGIMTAGTSDIPIAEEARLIACGCAHSYGRARRCITYTRCGHCGYPRDRCSNIHGVWY